MADPAYIVDGVLTDGEAWVALKSDVLTGTANSVTWTDPNDGSSLDWSQFMDFVLILSGRSDNTTGSYFKLYLNGSTTTKIGYQELKSDGVNAPAGYSYVGATTNTFGRNGAAISGVPTQSFAISVTRIFDVNSGKHKAVMHDSGWCTGTGVGDESLIDWNAALYTDQAPITEINVGNNPVLASDFVAGCRFDLFGVLPRMVA